MSTKIFLSLPVKDLKRAKAFYEGLGWHFNPQFSDDNGGCLVISDEIYAMLLTHEKFRSFSHDREIADTSKTAQVLMSLSVDSKDDMHRIVDAAIKSGAKEPEPMQDYGFMVSRSFWDLDGHGWNVLYMDPSHVQKN